MSRRKKTSVRWLVPAIILALVCAGLTVLVLKRYSSDRQPPGTTLQDLKSQKALPVPGANGGTNLSVTNQPKAEDPEDRVVALIAEGNQLLAQGKYPGAAQK